MTIKELEQVFEECKKEKIALCIAVTLPDRKDAEMIITHPNNLDYKLDYYKNAYTEDLVHKHNADIKIIEAFPVDFVVNNNEEEIDEGE